MGTQSTWETIKTPKNSNMATIVLGAQWGDEGKGKLVDILCPTVKLCARAQGGLALNPTKISNIFGVVKAYTTRVGGGPFPTEDLEEAGTKLQEIGREFGVTTGRRRRCGWLDLVVVKYSTAINHYTALNVTKLDILDTFPTIKVATAYIDPETGAELESFPADLEVLGRVQPKYVELKGWEKPITGAKSFYDLPKAAREYVEFIEEFVGVKVKYIGTGPGREAMITR